MSPKLTAVQFADTLKNWRAEHGFSQGEAAVAIGCTHGVVQSWEQQEHVPQQPALAEILRRLKMPVDAERVKLATRRQPVIKAEKFATRLREWRRGNRLSQAQAGRLLGTTARTIWVWEKARSLPKQPLAMLAKLDAQSNGGTEIHGWLKRSVRQRDPRIRFGKKLRAWRKANRLNQLEACKALGLPFDQALISNWEKGKALPRPARLKAIQAIIAKPLPVESPKLRFPSLLREWRKGRGLNQLAAAAVLGVGRDQAKISNWEKGRSLPRKPVLMRLLAKFKEVSK